MKHSPRGSRLGSGPMLRWREGVRSALDGRPPSLEVSESCAAARIGQGGLLRNGVPPKLKIGLVKLRQHEGSPIGVGGTNGRLLRRQIGRQYDQEDVISRITRGVRQDRSKYRAAARHRVLANHQDPALHQAEPASGVGVSLGVKSKADLDGQITPSIGSACGGGGDRLAPSIGGNTQQVGYQRRPLRSSRDDHHRTGAAGACRLGTPFASSCSVDDEVM